MAEKIKNIPSPDILMNSLRSIGYSFKTALADIIDNSISVDASVLFACKFVVFLHVAKNPLLR